MGETPLRPDDEETMAGVLTVIPVNPELLRETMIAWMVGEFVRLEVSVDAVQ